MAFNQPLSVDLSAMIAQVGSTRENTKMEISNLRRDVDLYRRQTRTILSQKFSEENFMKFRQLFKQFSQEIGPRAAEIADGDEYESDESYNVLRMSLGEAQKRCEHLNVNMLKVADANGDLVHTLNSLKNANKRLVDQLEQQSAEVSRLEQLAVLDEEKLLIFQRQQDEEMDQWRAETQFKLEDYTEIQNAQFESLKESHQIQVESVAKALVHIHARAKCIEDERGPLREEVIEQTQKITRNVAATTDDITKQIDAMVKLRKSEITNLHDIEHNLSVTLDMEREYHEGDILQWKDRVEKARLERDENTERLEKIQDRLQEELLQIENLGEEQHLAAQRDFKELCARSEELMADIASLTTMIEVSKCKATQLMNRSDVLQQNITKTDESLGCYRSEISDLQASYQEAVSNFDKLADEMGRMRTEAIQENERDLIQCKELYERKMELLHTSHRAEIDVYEDGTNKLSNVIAKVSSEEAMWSNKASGLNHQRTMLQRVCEMWRQHHDESAALTQKTLTESKQCKAQWDNMLKELDERRVAVVSQNQSVQNALEELSAETSSYQTSITEKLRSSSTHAETLQQTNAEAQRTLEEMQLSVKETSAKLQKMITENIQNQSAALQRQNELKREIELQANQHKETALAYNDALTQERRIEEGVSNALQRLKEENALETKRCAEIPLAKIHNIEQEMYDASTSGRAEIAQLNAQDQATLRELNSLSEEYQRQSQMVEDAQRNLQRDQYCLQERRSALDCSLSQPKVSSNRMPLQSTK